MTRLEVPARRLEAQALTREPWLRAVDLNLDRGELAVLRGPSGSGKSLLLRALADLDPRDAGSLRLDGVDAREVPPGRWRRQVRLVAQRPPALAATVRGVLDLAAELAGASRMEVPPGLAEAQPVARLSGGEAQLLALWSALRGPAEVLLLDEPTSAMDPELAARAEGWVRDWARGGGAVLWVSHDAGLAARLGAREVSL
ncbi:MAG: ATP-binding cassette domain-containing protein [Planctomycetes bacterium]|nr:ATP-binding cassette domain-containing protein [Planctomycetota bacterium]